ncbi:MAG: hypothetical protein SPK97_00535, partial [Bacteroidales bacterium]|nr:hypothetical protein [Bacteroidales bacterium]
CNRCWSYYVFFVIACNGQCTCKVCWSYCESAWIQTTPIVSQYFMTSPIANHHLLIKGHHAAKFWRE